MTDQVVQEIQVADQDLQTVNLSDFVFFVDPTQSSEPRISSNFLFQKLGYNRRSHLEELANSHKKFLNDFAVVRTVRVTGKVGATTRGWDLQLYTRDQALYLVTKSEKPVANQLTVQLIKAFRELEERLKPRVTPEALILAQAQALYDQRQRVDTVMADVEQLKLAVRRLEGVEEGRRALEAGAVESLRLLPGPTVEAPSKSTRSALNELVRQYALKNGGGDTLYREAWEKVYRELRLRDHFDAKRRAKNQNKSKLEVIEAAGKMEITYAIAREVLGKSDATSR